jgi:integrase
MPYQTYRIAFRKRWPNHTPHDTRHTFATIAARSGMDSNAVKRIMGHVIADITQGVYTHMTVEDLARELSKFRP